VGKKRDKLGVDFLRFFGRMTSKLCPIPRLSGVGLDKFLRKICIEPS